MTVKLCECGCGQPAPVATKSCQRDGWIKGQQKRFIHGHHRKLGFGTFKAGAAHPNYRGGRCEPRYASGYNRLLVAKGTYVMEHVLIAEAALGHPLPAGAVVHHRNGIRSDNRNNNLVILQNIGEHASVHRRLRVQQAGGDPWTQQRCNKCGECKDLSAFYRRGSLRCKQCIRIYDYPKRHRAKSGGDR